MPTVTITVSDQDDSIDVRGSPMPTDEAARSPAEQLAAQMLDLAAELARLLGGETHGLDEQGARVQPQPESAILLLPQP